MSKQFHDKVVIVTGGTKGIGGACTKVFAERGAKVVFTSRTLDEGKQYEEQLKLEGLECLYVQCDVMKDSDIENVIRQTVDIYGKIDVLVNNAATHISKVMDEYTLEDFEYLMCTNLRNYFLHSKYAIPYLKNTKGSIVNIASSTGKVGQYNASLYAATKGGIIAFTKSVALDYARYPVRVNAILPAYVDTPLLRSWINQQKDPENTERFLSKSHALGRISTSEEVAKVAAFLASEDASTITGSIVDADGGATLEYSPAVIDYK